MPETKDIPVLLQPSASGRTTSIPLASAVGRPGAAPWSNPPASPFAARAPGTPSGYFQGAPIMSPPVLPAVQVPAVQLPPVQVPPVAPLVPGVGGPAAPAPTVPSAEAVEALAQPLVPASPLVPPDFVMAQLQPEQREMLRQAAEEQARAVIEEMRKVEYRALAARIFGNDPHTTPEKAFARAATFFQYAQSEGIL